MSKLMKKKGLMTFLVIVIIIVLLVLFFQLKGTSISDNSDKYEGVDLETSDDYGRTDTYARYVKAHGDAVPEGEENTYDVDVYGYSDSSEDVEKREDVGPEGDKTSAVIIPEEGYVTYTVDVK